jgi:hypothetical protein
MMYELSEALMWQDIDLNTVLPSTRCSVLGLDNNYLVEHIY